jgi:LysM repeat protein
MSKKDAKNVISSYRKKQKLGPYILGGLAIVLAIVGIVLLVIYLFGNGGGDGINISFGKSKTPTPTETLVPTLTSTATNTPTITPTVTNTPTITPTNTPSGPFEYEVQEGDNCFDIAAEFEVDIEVLLALNPSVGNNCLINPGDIILIPTTDQELPTSTPLPTDLAPGTELQYTVRLGDTLTTLAEQFFSTVDRIIEETNKYRAQNDIDPLEDQNDIRVGDLLIIPYYIATPVPTSTSTVAPTATTAP